MTDELQLKYPIGKFIVPITYTPDELRGWINDIQLLPQQVKQTVSTLNDVELDTPYRPGGWTIRQVVHHLADSHMNSLIRFKWALTEDIPIIKPYEQTAWATLPDYRLPITPSLLMLEGIHQRLVALFESFTDEEWNCAFVHPESGATIHLKRNLALYAWHGKHHLAHITETVKRF